MYKKQITAALLVIVATIFVISHVIHCSRTVREQHVEHIEKLLRDPAKIKKVSQSGIIIQIEEKTLGNIPGEGITHSIELNQLKNPELLDQYAIVGDR